MALRRDILPILLFSLLPLGLAAACDEDEPEAPDGGGGASPGGASSGDASCVSDKDCRAVDGLCDLGRSVCVDCFTSADCGENEECSAGVCEAYTPCQSSKDCPIDQVCDSDLARCVECVGDNDCAEGAVCFATRCSASCVSDKDCAPFTQVCDTAISVCVDCVTNADCGSGFACGENGQCVSDLSGGDGDGDAGATGGSSNGGDGDGPAACAPKVKILLQRSGAMFENPSDVDSWWDAVSSALDGGAGTVLENYASRLDLSVSTFHRTENSCPLIDDSADSLGAGDLMSFLSTQRSSHQATAGEKIDAPLPEAIAAGAAAVGSGGYLILAVSGNPDSCATIDNWCSIVPTIEALQTASRSGVTTKLLFLGSDAPAPGYEQAVANAGAGQSVAQIEGIEEGCGPQPTYFSEGAGSASFEAPVSTSAVSASLARLLDSVGGCE